MLAPGQFKASEGLSAGAIAGVAAIAATMRAFPGVAASQLEGCEQLYSFVRMAAGRSPEDVSRRRDAATGAGAVGALTVAVASCPLSLDVQRFAWSTLKYISGSSRHRSYITSNDTFLSAAVSALEMHAKASLLVKSVCVTLGNVLSGKVIAECAVPHRELCSALATLLSGCTDDGVRVELIFAVKNIMLHFQRVRKARRSMHSKESELFMYEMLGLDTFATMATELVATLKSANAAALANISHKALRCISILAESDDGQLLLLQKGGLDAAAYALHAHRGDEKVVNGCLSAMQNLAFHDAVNGLVGVGLYGVDAEAVVRAAGGKAAAALLLASAKEIASGFPGCAVNLSAFAKVIQTALSACAAGSTAAAAAPEAGAAAAVSGVVTRGRRGQTASAAKKVAAA